MGRGEKRAAGREQEQEREEEVGRKTARIEEKEQSEGSSSDSDTESDGELALDREQGEEVQMSFMFNDMRDEYCNGLATLLQREGLLGEREAAGVASGVVRQEEVGTVVCCEDDTEVFAYATVLPLRRVKQNGGEEAECWKGLKVVLEGLLESCKKLSGDEKDLLVTHLEGKKKSTTGLFLHGRFMNLPLQLCGALQANLVDDLKWAKENDDSDDKVFKEMSSVLLVVSCAMEKGQEVAKKSCVNITGNSSVLFDSFEDDVYFQESLCSFAFRPDESEKTYAAVLVPVSSLSSCVSQISAMTAM